MPEPVYAAYPVFAPAQPAAPQPYPYAHAAQPAYPPQPIHPGLYAQPYPAQPQMPQGYAPQFAPAPMAAPPVAYWQQPQQAYPYTQPGAVHAGMYAPQQPAYPPQPMPQHYAQPAPAQPAPVQAAPAEPSQIEEIRASLRECRDAIRDLTEQRAKRRYF